MIPENIANFGELVGHLRYIRHYMRLHSITDGAAPVYDLAGQGNVVFGGRVRVLGIHS